MKRVISLLLVIFTCVFVFAGSTSSTRQEFYIAETDNSTDLIEPVVSEGTNGLDIGLIIVLAVAVILIVYYLLKPKKRVRKIKRKGKK